MHVILLRFVTTWHRSYTPSRFFFYSSVLSPHFCHCHSAEEGMKGRRGNASASYTLQQHVRSICFLASDTHGATPICRVTIFESVPLHEPCHDFFFFSPSSLPLPACFNNTSIAFVSLLQSQRRATPTSLVVISWSLSLCELCLE